MDDPGDTSDDDDDDPSPFPVRWRADRFLQHLNPKKLVIKIVYYPHDPEELAHLISRDAAHTMAQWSRLEVVHFADVPLLTPHETATNDVENVAGCILFLNLRAESLAGHGQVSVTWDIAKYVDFVDESFSASLDRLVHEDGLLQQPFLSSFTLLVHNQDALEELQTIVKEIEDVPDVLRCEVDGQKSA